MLMIEDRKPFFRAVIMPNETGWKVRDVLKRHYHFSTGLIRNIKNDGVLQVNKENVYFTKQLNAWDIVELYLEQQSKVFPEVSSLKIVYEDDEILVINKSSGQIMHPRHQYISGTLANYIAGYLAEKGEVPSSYLINRLDKGTSGLVLVAKNPLAASILSEEVGQMKKVYLALTHGNFSSDNGVIDFNIVEPKEGIKRTVGPQGKTAITRYQVIKRYADFTLVKLSLESGRTHQIRVHLSATGHPIAGDDFYGEATNGFERIFLHASYLEFFHPKTGSILKLKAKLPSDLYRLLEGLKEL